MLGTIFKIAFPVLDFLFRLFAHNEKMKSAYISFLEISSRNGVRAALNRLSAQEQIDAVNKLWAERKARNDADSKTKAIEPEGKK